MADGPSISKSLGKSRSGLVPRRTATEKLNESEQDDIYLKIATMPLSKLNQLKQSLGSELSKKICGEKSDRRKLKGGKRPVELSSKRTNKLQQTQFPTKKNFDPRFSRECGGQFDKINFHRNYDFLSDMRQREIKEFRKALHDAKNSGDETAILRVEKNLRRLENQDRANKKECEMERVRADLRQTNIDRMREGLKPIILTKNELNKRYERCTRMNRDDSQSTPTKEI